MSPRPPAIELRHLRYFLAVVEELHFGRAAQRLHISQPPLSQAIRKLESELGVELLHRTSRLVTATEAGLAFAEQARKVVADVDLAVAEARRAGGAESVVRIGCTSFLQAERLQRFLAAVHERDPELRTSITHLDTRSRRLLLGELDLAIVQLAGDVPGIQTEPIFRGEPITAFVPPSHPLARKESITPEDVADEALIAYPSTENASLHARFYGMIANAGYRFRETREASGPTERDLLLAAAEGPGVLLGTHSLKDLNEAGRFVVRCRLDPPVPMPDTALAWRENPPPQLARTLATLRAVARDLRAADGEPSQDPFRARIATT